MPDFNSLPLLGGRVLLYLGALYTVRLGRLNRYGLYGLYVVRLDRPLLPVSKYAPSTMNATMRYKAHNQYALTMNATSRIHFKGDIRHYNTVTRSVDLGTRGKRSAVQKNFRSEKHGLAVLLCRAHGPTGAKGRCPTGILLPGRWFVLLPPPGDATVSSVIPTGSLHGSDP